MSLNDDRAGERAEGPGRMTLLYSDHPIPGFPRQPYQARVEKFLVHCAVLRLLAVVGFIVSLL